MSDSGKHILIVDDNNKNLQLTATFLKDEGYLISLAQSGEAALFQLEELIPDLLLLDIMMPGMDGLELCRIIKDNKTYQDIPVIFLTAKTQTEDLAEGFKAGGVDYIVKPFNREELLIRVKNHIELASSRKKIIEMNNNRDKLYSIIAHDIRSPFASIALTLNAIAGGYLDPSGEDFREIMVNLEKTANETSILLDNLLEFTRLQRYSMAISPRQLPVYPVILETIQLLKGNADNKKISITTDISESLTAYFDEVSIFAVFRNVVFNAIKFTPENGSIEINAISENGYVRVRVADTGVGIPEDVIKKIFVNNEHYTTRGTNSESGSGLGSFIIKDFVIKNNGKLEIMSTPGSGTEVMIYLPVKESK
jgi:two-component system, sensor histidine kinase and response regulator